MTSPAAAAAILVLFDSTAPSANVITLTFEVIRMACRAIDCISLRGCILWMRIRQRIIHGVPMAGAAPRVPSMIARVAPLRAMAKDVWCPGVCRMTFVTLESRTQVPLRLEGCSIAGAVTGIALTPGTIIVEPRATDEARGGMTEMAVHRGRDMAWMLAGRGDPVTGRAVVHDTGMIEHRTDKCAGVMTDTAILVGRHMID